jgi:hypothetical protein
MLSPRPKTYDAYWQFAARRQEVFFNRLHSKPWPWTDDEIISTYKFCNTYRASDRVSQYLIKNVIYGGTYLDEDVVFRILLFKIFNKIETWQYLERHLGHISLATFEFERVATLLARAVTEGQAIYTSAYMSCATKAFGYDRKHQNHLALIEHMVRKDKLTSKITSAKSLEEVFLLLNSYPLIGNFMAYQLATDLNYSEVINFSENSFTMAGPGAERGIKKCFLDTGRNSTDYVIKWMQENQEKEFERLGLQFKSLWGRNLQLIDCQGLFCETDKYSRVAFPELKSNRKRIKATFEPNQHPIEYFFPPKWGLNERIASELPRTEVAFTLPHSPQHGPTTRTRTRNGKTLTLPFST